ncbi:MULTISPECIES: FixH family protein [unclassified Novosphingobium]|uniref:FixH family protein n=1 Tax=unclassified Novosphingobium TaxID=2644732 RepID=UPI001826630B|nr:MULTISPECIES: FixH family protein [unclassified Novosphingobium]MBB3357124.1 nitrogen fixation protein FixH [Novosphingobium sp. BK256]MBB3376806.1 nitrogen fixation protein FixH [Novosphingobium sp. BK280]MBB3377895.1 nitrogen fixation protein FixH [Novosphingobium sp. BK258]MBB3418695.1 nitrogen fixation protein FixH [Novosphingobium sp. BK267]MBB3451570.1 nitrogen fixation protein FixH [Novosphingobium sp. BK352]
MTQHRLPQDAMPVTRVARPFTARPFTGRHMAAILITFFGVVIIVNVVMARLALSTFGGVVVENSYVASQNFNRWLGEARSEKALGFAGSIARDETGALAVVLNDAQGHAIAGAAVTALAEHPLGLRDDLALSLNETAPGHYRAALPGGRWRIKLKVVQHGATWRMMGDVG